MAALKNIDFTSIFLKKFRYSFFTPVTPFVLNVDGPYNTKYKFHADYDYFYRMIVKNKMTGISTNKDEVTGIFRN